MMRLRPTAAAVAAAWTRRATLPTTTVARTGAGRTATAALAVAAARRTLATGGRSHPMPTPPVRARCSHARPPPAAPARADAPGRGGGPPDDGGGSGGGGVMANMMQQQPAKGELLKRYTTDLTALAADGKLDPVIGALPARAAPACRHGLTLPP